MRRCNKFSARSIKEDENKHQPESESIQNQKSLLTHYAIYCDEDFSGVNSDRPDFNRMIQAARQKKFQIVLCKSQSRFTRDMELVEKYIHGLFLIWGVRFIAVADNADTEVKDNKKTRQINGLTNEWYLEDLSENVRMVFDLKRRKGKYIGGFPTYGYQKDPADKNHIIPDPEAAEVVRQIYQWSLEGHGWQNIACLPNQQGIPNPTRYKTERSWNCNHPVKNDFGLWNKVTMGRILTNEMYTGVMLQGCKRKVSYKSKVIIDRATFDAVQRNLRLRTRTDGSGEAHLLSGLVKCADCGSTMSKSSNGKRSYLRCKLDAKGIQPQKDTRREALEQKSLTAQLKKRSQALKTLYLDKAAGIISGSQFVELNQSFLDEKSRLERRLAHIEDNLLQREATQQQTDLMERARERLKLETVPRELVVGLIDRIEIGERHPETGRQDVSIT